MLVFLSFRLLNSRVYLDVEELTSSHGLLLKENIYFHILTSSNGLLLKEIICFPILTSSNGLLLKERICYPYGAYSFL